MRCSLASRLGLEKPILQAPIGSVACVELAAAVSNAGAMGSLALTWTEPATARERVLELRRRTSRNFFVNFVLTFEAAALDAVLDAGAPVITFSWGLPGDRVGKAHARGAQVGVQVGTAEGARRAMAEGCDFLICQGVEAGGHVQSSTPLRELLCEVADVAGETPVIAAGGITDGRDIAAALRQGAQAVMLGTRFVASRESRAHPLYKKALVESDGETVMTGCFDGGWPYALHRVLRNSTLSKWEDGGCPRSGLRPGEGEIVATGAAGNQVARYDDMPPTEDMQGDVLALCLYAGAGVAKIREILPAAELVNSMWTEATRGERA